MLGSGVTNRSLLLVCVFLLTAFSTSHAAKQDFLLVNKTGVDIQEVYVAPHGSEEWQEDVMGRDMLVNGQSVKINFERQIKGKVWDLKVVDKDGKASVWQNLNLTEITKITLHLDGGKATAEVE